VINLSTDNQDNRDAVLLSYPMIVSMCGQITQLVELIQAELKNNPQSKSVRYLYSYLYSKLLDNCAAPSIRYLSEHYDLPITVNQLAQMENYNVTYYNDWFKQQTGCSPNLFLRKLRIDRAKELLEGTGFSVMEIAVMVGYSSNSTFTRAFHSITGMTPKDYRGNLGLTNAG
jgi:AraC-like DNA-binding protein